MGRMQDLPLHRYPVCIGARLGLLFHKVEFASEILFKRACAFGYFLIHIRVKVSYKSVHPVPGQALHRATASKCHYL